MWGASEGQGCVGEVEFNYDQIAFYTYANFSKIKTILRVFLKDECFGFSSLSIALI